MQKWKATPIYDTHDVTSHNPVWVLDRGPRAPNDQRYAIAWIDPKSCTADAIFRNMSGMMLAMEQQVYDIDQ
jgi:hypothetical protein